MSSFSPPCAKLSTNNSPGGNFANANILPTIGEKQVWRVKQGKIGRDRLHLSPYFTRHTCSAGTAPTILSLLCMR